MTVGYGMFQTANNTAVMKELRPDQRGVISGLLNLSRNLGLISGASVMGAVFALASATTDITTARPEAVATGMRITFAVAAGLIVGALAIALARAAGGNQFRDAAVELNSGICGASWLEPRCAAFFSLRSFQYCTTQSEARASHFWSGAFPRERDCGEIFNAGGWRHGPGVLTNPRPSGW